MMKNKIFLILLISLVFMVVGGAGLVSADGIDEYTKLMLHSDGDDSASEHTYTANGNPQLDAVIKKIGDGSMYFNGSSFLSIPDSDDWDFGSGDFTIDFWVYRTSTGNHDYIFNQWTTNYDGIYFVINDNDKLQFHAGNDAWTIALTSTTSIGANSWHHVAAVRVENNWTIYLDGTLEDYTIDPLSLTDKTSDIAIGIAVWNLASNPFEGYIDELRVSKGQARWTTNFVPDTIPYEPDADTKLLLHLDGDSSDLAYNVTFNGNVSVSASEYQFDGSYYFDGDGDYLTVPDSEDWDFDSGDFTIDMWVKFSSSPDDLQYFTSHYEDESNFWQLSHYSGGTGIRFGVYSSGGYIVYINGGEISDTDWHHIALVKSSTTYYLFKDGSQVDTDTDDSLDTFVGTLFIGKAGTPGYPYYFPGYIDELRISKGIARWTSNFTVPTSAYSLSIDYGNLTLSWISPDESTYVAQNEFWNYTFNLSCSSGGDCGFVEITLDPWAINELMAGNDLQLDSEGNVIGVVEAESAIIEKNWLAKVMEFVKEIFKN